MKSSINVNTIITNFSLIPIKLVDFRQRILLRIFLEKNNLIQIKIIINFQQKMGRYQSNEIPNFKKEEMLFAADKR